jgi:hypothetical protein
VDSRNIYWGQGQSVYACPITGGCGAGTKIYTLPNAGAQQLLGLAAPPASSSPYAGYVFVLYSNGNDTDSDYLVPLNLPSGSTTWAGNPEVASTNQSYGLVFDGVNNNLFSLSYCCASNYLVRMGANGMGSTGIGNLSSSYGYVGVDSTNVYAADPAHSQVVYCPLTGTCSTGTVAMTVPSPWSVFSDGTYVWATARGTADAGASGGIVARCTVGINCGTSYTAMATGQTFPWNVVADKNYVYWTNSAASPQGAVMRCPVAGCGSGPTVMLSVSNPQVLLQDASAIYFASDAGIQKIAK